MANSSQKNRLVERLIASHLCVTQNGYFDLRPVLGLVDTVAAHTNKTKVVHHYLVGLLLMELFTVAELSDFLNVGMSDFP